MTRRQPVFMVRLAVGRGSLKAETVVRIHDR